MSERVRCYDCFRPEAQCLCGLMARVENKTEIVILQHPKERAHAFNTVRIAEKSLARAEVVVGHIQDLAVDASLTGRLEGFGLLYPSAEAQDLSLLPEEERPTKLVVLDGTWHHARAMYRYIEALHALPHYTLPAGQVSGFRIRKQPKSYCLSSLEAIQSALGHLEPHLAGLEDLLRPFEAMQSRHLSSTQTATPRRKRQRRKEAGPKLPAAFGKEFGSLVIVYGELSPIVVKGAARELLTFAAVRPATGETFHRVIANVPIAPSHLPLLRLSENDLQQATPLADVHARWRAFLEPGDTIAAWSNSTLSVIGQTLDTPGPCLPIKGHYLNLRRHQGALEEIIEQEGLLSGDPASDPQPTITRTEERLRNVAAVVGLLNGLASHDPPIAD